MIKNHCSKLSLIYVFILILNNWLFILRILLLLLRVISKNTKLSNLLDDFFCCFIVLDKLNTVCLLKRHLSHSLIDELYFLNALLITLCCHLKKCLLSTFLKIFNGDGAIVFVVAFIVQTLYETLSLNSFLFPLSEACSIVNLLILRKGTRQFGKLFDTWRRYCLTRRIESFSTLV